MKPKLVVALILICLFMSCRNDEEVPLLLPCLPASLQANVIAFYPFSQGSLLDASSNSNDLVNPTSARPVQDRNGNADCAYRFANTQTVQEYLFIQDPAFLNGLNSFSVSVWYQPLNPGRDVGDYEVLVGRGDQLRCPDRNGEWSVGLYDCRRATFGHDNSVWANAFTDPYISCEDELAALTDTWHHMVGVKNLDTMRLYFNGVLQETRIGSADCPVPQPAQDIGSLFIGNKFSGDIDDVVIYNRGLTGQEVQSLYSLETCCE